ncbi:MAG TPA: phosphoribosylformylglycinamidine synthase [Desulfovibrio sp.]|jgi:phosphoribosylformylglycinamidine synthase|nr:phosphoribosylformylglycinamidine synthase [Desulfovibrio sp.]
MSLLRLEIRVKENQQDPVGRRVAEEIKEALGFNIDTVRMVKVLTFDGIGEEEAGLLLEKAVMHDPVLQSASLQPSPSDADFILEVSFRPGVTDNEGNTARNTAALVLGKERDTLKVYTAKQYHLWGKITRAEAEKIGRDLLANELIERLRIKSREEWAKEAGFEAQASKVTGKASDTVRIIPLLGMSDAELIDYSRKNTLALTLEEMLIIKNFYAKDETKKDRAQFGLPENPTDAELEVLAQTWSEHCKHKIFAAKIEYVNTETGKTQHIDSLYKTYIKTPTATIRKRLGDNDFCRSVFSDNAGVMAFNDDYDVCIKVETHNSPSALDPYGGALTGIVGVNRDPMGTGMGAELICNTDVFCFASPFHADKMPSRLLHPRRVMEGVRKGVEDGGNKSGIPTVNGAIVFDERYLGKPLVYCGTVGLMPRRLHGMNGFEKIPTAGDAIVMTGGRIGKDGIHGATFSSEELHEESPATAVQIGDPITQRKMYDFIIRARDLGLYHAITDNGAGGLSSSVGEMSEATGGCRLDLSKAPLKYDGLQPWEILLSEAQERMTLAVPQDKLQEFLALAEHMDVEATCLGEFTDTGYFQVFYGKKPVANLPMDFMHNGLPQMRLKAVWKAEQTQMQNQVAMPDTNDKAEFLLKMLGRLNICSKENIVRQYDHEVKGGSVVKPFVGKKQDAPADAAVLRPVLEDEAGIVISNGICPKFSDYDTYHMMANALDEAVRNAVAAGADPDHMAGCDNFCWCDPIQSEKTPDGEYKLAQLVRACEALGKYCMDYGVPCISGKDSMKNDYIGDGKKISIPPTVLFSVLAKIGNVNNAVTSDFKAAGNKIYLLGYTKNEMAGSEAFDELGIKGGRVPQVDSGSALARYRAFHKAAEQKLVKTCHDLSDGGLAVALAEMCIGGLFGAKVDLEKAGKEEDMTTMEILYSESASRFLAEVEPGKCAEFEKLFENHCYQIGEVGEANADLSVYTGESLVFTQTIDAMAQAFKKTLNA